MDIQNPNIPNPPIVPLVKRKALVAINVADLPDAQGWQLGQEHTLTITVTKEADIQTATGSSVRLAIMAIQENTPATKPNTKPAPTPTAPVTPTV